MHFAFSSVYDIEPQTSDVINLDGTHVIPYSEGDLDGEDPHYQWYRPDIVNSQTNIAIQIQSIQNR